MKTRSPEVFVSATTADLFSCRQLIKNALLTIGCKPVEQTNFPTDYRSISEMLRAKIEKCDAVVHVAGVCYGFEPTQRPAGAPRRSYTQMEYDFAREMGKRVYVLVCGDGFPYDNHPGEDAEKRELQQRHRAHLLGADTLRYDVRDFAEIEKRVREIQALVEELEKELAESRRRLRRVVAVGTTVVIALGIGVGLLGRRMGRNERAVAGLAAQFAQERHYTESLREVVVQQEAKLKALDASDDEKFERAITAVAEREKVPAATVRTGIARFIAATRQDPRADELDLALANFAEKNFAASAEGAGRVVAAAREQRRAAEKLSTEMAAQAKAARARERAALRLQGSAFYAKGDLSEAAGAFEAALEVTPRTDDPVAWAALQRDFGSVMGGWAEVSTGRAIRERRSEAIRAFRAALEVFDRPYYPFEWARTQNALAKAVLEQALATQGAGLKKDLAEAIAADREILEVATRAAAPDMWGDVQYELAVALTYQAAYSPLAERPRLLDEAVAIHRQSLEVRTRAEQPVSWAYTCNNLAISLRAQAMMATEAERSRLVAEAIANFRSAAEVITRARFPREWAQIQHGLGEVLRDRAEVESGEQKIRTLSEAIATYGEALEIRTRRDYPQHWAQTQASLAIALRDQALATGGARGIDFLEKAIAAFRGALEVFTPRDLPQDWAVAQHNLALALSTQADFYEGAERARLLAESVAALRATLTVFTPEDLPDDWALAMDNLASTLRDLALSSPERDRPRLLAESAAVLRSIVARSGGARKTEAQHELAKTVIYQFSSAEPAARAPFLAEIATLERAVLARGPEVPRPIWAAAQNNLAAILRMQAGSAPAGEKAALLKEALAGCRAALEVFNERDTPDEWRGTQDNLALIQNEIAQLSPSGPPLGN
jgi:tetratricopeptide (TPR) repeat protein